MIKLMTKKVKIIVFNDNIMIIIFIEPMPGRPEPLNVLLLVVLVCSVVDLLLRKVPSLLLPSLRVLSLGLIHSRRRLDLPVSAFF